MRFVDVCDVRFVVAIVAVLVDVRVFEVVVPVLVGLRVSVSSLLVWFCCTCARLRFFSCVSLILSVGLFAVAR